MSTAERLSSEAGRRPISLRLPVSKLQLATLWLLIFGSAFVIMEPSPYEVIFLLTGSAFLTSLRFYRPFIALVVLLALFNLGGIFALVPFFDERPSVMFVIISIYLMMTTIFFAGLMGEHPVERLDTIRSGYIAAAWAASIAAILGYFDVAGLGERFTLYGRASGTFKDPNVLGPFLVLPLIYLLQGAFERRTSLLRSAILASAPFFALFLSFSRGAWGHIIASLGLFFLLTFLTSRSAAERTKLTTFAVVAVATLAMVLAIALSFEGIREVFEVRASLTQDYDEGVTGRFGNQLRSIPVLLDNPNGLGPLRFRFHFDGDPHNVYVNSFSSYGWLGGLSYLALVAATVVVGWKTVFVRRATQKHAIAIWSTLFVTIVQGFQIDTDHWRHFFMMLGLMWGLAAVTHARSPKPAPS
ncbi:O-antigen ligase family protein [Chelatococcus sp. SYSU_G07232]|uniref:O-antigen ligase family protein n=1 Tax=Chelatococcus albus TaxID=3047466 RepID=A0ABT7AC27_9HYPH|nr:O-antigen ligase family protein [Chelatococcus sp. SYSU_G07232]MDJ1156917.1 O-antigen ligase family protein [Chelatococcus sp. SYSU_G07232]